MSTGEVAQVVAWDREGLVHPHDFMNRYSKQHVAFPPDANHALCGSAIRWLYIAPGDSTRCDRCYAIAEKRGYVDDWGEPIVSRASAEVL